MNKKEKQELKRKILLNFVKLIENKGLQNDPELSEAYKDLKKSLKEKK